MLGDRLKLARKRAGLSLRDLAERLDDKVTAQAISKYESGKMYPSSGVLVALAKSLAVSLDFLMSEQVEALSGVEFRKHSSATAAERALAEASVIDALERQLALDEILGLDSAQNDLPSKKVTVRSFDDVEHAAEQLRDDWKLGMAPVPSMTGLLEDKGVKIIAVDIPKKVSGLTGNVRRPGEKPDVPVIVVSTQFTIERRRFTLAHELAHRVIGECGAELKCEKAMDRFAAAFLIPAKNLQEEVRGARDALPPYKEIVRLKHLYGVAAAVILMRLRDIGVLSDATVSYAFQTYARTWRTVEPMPLDSNGDFARLEQPSRFERSVYWALADRLISLPHAAELLRRPVSQVELEFRGPSLGDSASSQR
jgi:Zn-dependent peptidase ImmA (M78 family)/transcriptional regulator with XRE-family HTH domain